MGAVAANLIEQLWTLHFADALMNGTNAGAFQLAVCNLEYNAAAETFSLASGNVIANDVGGGSDVAVARMADDPPGSARWT